jgi:hypothetical protein
MEVETEYKKKLTVKLDYEIENEKHKLALNKIQVYKEMSELFPETEFPRPDLSFL